MTIVEALRSGKPLCRPICKHRGSAGVGFLDPDYVIHLLTCGQIRELRPIIIDREDLLADDWMVKEE